jgi:hypothetical protein
MGLMDATRITVHGEDGFLDWPNHSWTGRQNIIGSRILQNLKDLREAPIYLADFRNSPSN